MRPSIAGRHQRKTLDVPIVVTRASRMPFECVVIHYPELQSLAIAFNKTKESHRMDILATHVKSERSTAGQIKTEDLDITVLDNK